MALYAGGLIPWLEQRFFTSNGAPLSLGTVETYIAGTSTPLATFTTADLTPGTEHDNPIELGADGRPPNPIFLQATGYKFVVRNALGAEQYTIDKVEDVGQVFAQNLGPILTEGGKSQVSGYTILATDYLVTINSSGGPTPCVVNLLAAASARKPVIIKNIGSIALAVTPNGADTVEGVNAAYSVPAGASPNWPTLILAPDAVSSWWILASHKVP